MVDAETIQLIQSVGIIPGLFVMIVIYVLKMNKDQSDQFHTTLKEMRAEMRDIHTGTYAATIKVMQSTSDSLQKISSTVESEKEAIENVLVFVQQQTKDFNGFASAMRIMVDRQTSDLMSVLAKGLQIKSIVEKQTNIAD